MINTKICGFPIWRGMKRRVAKKYFKGYRKFMLRAFDYANIKIGDYVNDCTGYNGKIISMEPVYCHIGKTGKGSILVDVDIQTTNTGCSLTYCGVYPALPQQEVEAKAIDFHRNWTLSQPGKNWYGGNTEKYAQIIARTEKMIALFENGEHFTNEYGVVLPEFDSSKFIS